MASVTGENWPTSPVTVRPVSAFAGAPTGAAAGAFRSASMAAGISPFATLPIVMRCSAVSGREPGAAPFACNRNAARFT